MAKVTFTYTLPERLRYDGGPATVTLQQLTTSQELSASTLGEFNLLKTQFEAVKLAIAALDGKPQDPSTGAVDTFFEKSGPVVRTLLINAHNKISSPTEEDRESFLASEKAAAT